MASSLINHVVADLCLGKPALSSLPVSSATVADALSAIRNSQDHFISVWSCAHQNQNTNVNESTYDHGCKCVGKICMVDIICFLCKDENLSSPSSALLSPVSALLSKDSKAVQHLDPSTSLLEAIDYILQGAQNLVVPIRAKSSIHSRRKHSSTFHNGREYCWLTQEDVIQFIQTRIGLFTPIPNLSVEALGLIQTEILTVDYHAPATVALEAIAQSLQDQTSVGVVDEDCGLVGEISPFTLCGCDETVSAAIMALSAGDLMSYIDWGGPHEDIVKAMKATLTEKELDGLLELLTDDYSSDLFTSSSSDDESLFSSSSSSTSTSTTTRLTRYNRSWSYSARMLRRAEAIVCHPKSSLVAVMVQAIAHRVNYVWVMEDDCTVVGIVTYRDILHVFRDHLESLFEGLCA